MAIETNVTKPVISFFENEETHLIINQEFETSLDEKLNTIETFMKTNVGKGKSDEEKDEVYKQAQILWNDYITTLTNTKYNFHLNRSQYNFVTDLILTKIEYDVNTVFFGMELLDMLGVMRNTKYSNDKELVSFPVNATEITYIYHLISKQTVTGLSKKAFSFVEVLKRIGNISKVFNYYDTYGKNLSTDIQNWVLSFEEGVTIEGSTVLVEPTTAEFNTNTTATKPRKTSAKAKPTATETTEG